MSNKTKLDADAPRHTAFLEALDQALADGLLAEFMLELFGGEKAPSPTSEPEAQSKTQETLWSKRLEERRRIAAARPDYAGYEACKRSIPAGLSPADYNRAIQACAKKHGV